MSANTADDPGRDALAAQIAERIERVADGSRDDAALDRLLGALASWQARRVEPYGRLAARAALPTDVFRYVRVAGHPPELDVRVWRTSGTTSGRRGEHPLRDLSLYDLAARTAARHALFPDVERMRLIMMAPRPEDAPDSSLSYMLGRFQSWFGTRTDWLFPVDGRLGALLRSAREPIGLLGTSFAFVHAEDQLGAERFALPAGSRVMQTGGFKGRSRAIEPEALRRAIAERYGVAEASIVEEYGMTELSSQMYQLTLRGVAHRRFWVPGWVRATVRDTETLAELSEGEAGILRIDDAANLDSVCAIQTSDLAVVRDGAIELLGRASGATPRGCSLAIEEALG